MIKEVIEKVIRRVKKWFHSVVMCVYYALDSIKLPGARIKYVVIKGSYKTIPEGGYSFKDKFTFISPVRKCFVIKCGLFNSVVLTLPLDCERVISNKYIFKSEEKAIACATELGHISRTLAIDNMFSEKELIKLELTDEEKKQIEELEKRYSCQCESKKKQPVKKSKTTTKKSDKQLKQPKPYKQTKQRKPKSKK